MLLFSQVNQQGERKENVAVCKKNLGDAKNQKNLSCWFREDFRVTSSHSDREARREAKATMAQLMDPSDNYPSDWFTIVSELSGLALDVPYALKEPKTKVWMYQANGTEGA